MSLTSLILRACPATVLIDPACPVANHAAASVARRIASILLPFLALIGAWQHVLGPLALPVWTRISRTHQRLARLLGQLAAGSLPRRHATPGSAAAPRRTGARSAYFSRRPGWLPAMLDYNARGLAAQLGTLLHEPGIADAIATSPGAARTLRPLCRMFGITLPAALQLPPRPARPRPVPSQAPPTPAPTGLHLPATATPDGATPDRPIPAYVLAAARAWKRRSRKTA